MNWLCCVVWIELHLFMQGYELAVLCCVDRIASIYARLFVWAQFLKHIYIFHDFERDKDALLDIILDSFRYNLQ